MSQLTNQNGVVQSTSPAANTSQSTSLVRSGSSQSGDSQNDGETDQNDSPRFVQPPAETMNSFRIFGSLFIVDSRYSPRRGLGKGAYGVVISAVDGLTKDPVAIKKIPNMFADHCDALRVLRELKLLRHFNHENIIKLRDCIPSYGEFEEMYMVLDLMSTDVHKVIYSNNNVTLDHIRFIIYQVLCGLKYIHSCGVVHRDLKPSNLLINADSTLKICDFGLSRGIKEQDYLTEYVVTRWYRAPEVMCSADAYDFKIDIWALGCILCELLNRNPLFPGDDYRKQLNLIFNALGTPTESDCEFITNEFALSYIRGLAPRAGVPVSRLVKTTDADCLDLISKMLKFNPRDRISVDEALKHPFLSVYYSWNTNHVFSQPKKWDNSFENYLQGTELNQLNIQQYCLREIFHFHPEFIPTLGRRYHLLDSRGELRPEPTHLQSPPVAPLHQPVLTQIHYQRLVQREMAVRHLQGVDQRNLVQPGSDDSGDFYSDISPSAQGNAVGVLHGPPQVNEPLPRARQTSITQIGTQTRTIVQGENDGQ